MAATYMRARRSQGRSGGEDREACDWKTLDARFPRVLSGGADWSNRTWRVLVKPGSGVSRDGESYEGFYIVMNDDRDYVLIRRAVVNDEYDDEMLAEGSLETVLATTDKILGRLAGRGR